VANAARAEKPDHIRRNAADAVYMAAPSVLSVAGNKRTADDGWNVLALRSDVMSFTLVSFFYNQCKIYYVVNIDTNARTAVCTFSVVIY